MDTREKLIAARVGMLALADELKNISRACQVAGISRTHFYDIKDAFERYGGGAPSRVIIHATATGPSVRRSSAKYRSRTYSASLSIRG